MEKIYILYLNSRIKMSTFCGYFDEIKGLSVDRFDGENLQSSLFFLSHAHHDHMHGLKDNSEHFLYKLKNESHIYLHASPVTTKILQQWFPEHKHKFCSLTMEEATVIKIPKSKILLTVTCIPAGHCPGSVMFLFEWESSRILYTGDFRINTDDLEKYHQFYDTCGKLKKIDTMYLDTTFFNEKYKKFPSRLESVNVVCSLIKEWINNERRVHLYLSANYGYEVFFQEIWEKIKLPIWVSNEIYSIYKFFPHMDNIITSDRNKASITASYRGSESSTNTLRVIKPSAMSWTDWNKDDSLSMFYNNKHMVCFSTHASYEEIIAFINFLKPDNIKPNVGNSDNLNSLIQQSVNSYKKYVTSPEKSTNLKFNINYNKNRSKCTRNLDELLDSPPREEFKRTKL